VILRVRRYAKTKGTDDLANVADARFGMEVKETNFVPRMGAYLGPYFELVLGS
jgi:hypothetical protein